MVNIDLYLFIHILMSCDSTDPWFWNLVALSRNDLNRYSGPKDAKDYEKKNQIFHYSEKRKSLNRILLQFYETRNSAETQNYLAWVMLLSPLVARYDQIEFSLNDYNNILQNLDKIQSPKLQYDIVCRVIAKLDKRKQYDTDVYFAACAYRATCKYAQTDTSKQTQDVKIYDLGVCIKRVPDSATKRKLAVAIIKILRTQLNQALKKSGNVSEIKQICANAYNYVALAGAENQDYVDMVWDEFNFRNIIKASYRNGPIR